MNIKNKIIKYPDPHWAPCVPWSRGTGVPVYKILQFEEKKIVKRMNFFFTSWHTKDWRKKTTCKIRSMTLWCWQAALQADRSGVGISSLSALSPSFRTIINSLVRIRILHVDPNPGGFQKEDLVTHNWYKLQRYLQCI